MADGGIKACAAADKKAARQSAVGSDLSDADRFDGGRMQDVRERFCRRFRKSQRFGKIVAGTGRNIAKRQVIG